MEDKIFLGYQYGKFTGRDGNEVSFCQAFFIEEFPSVSGSDYHSYGLRGVKINISGADICAGLDSMDRVIVRNRRSHDP